MIMALRIWLARKLAPEMAREAEKYYYLHNQVTMIDRWFASIKPAAMISGWLLEREAHHWRRYSDPPLTAKYEWEISRFRDQYNREVWKWAMGQPRPMLGDD
jgi:hypothetical protein